MRRTRTGTLIALAIAGSLIGVSGVTAQDSLENKAVPERTPAQAAHAAAHDWLAPLVRPDLKRVNIRVAYCRPRGRWKGCRVHVTGATRCNGVLRVQVVGSSYKAWMPLMRCR